jgi:hypothetical protein
MGNSDFEFWNKYGFTDKIELVAMKEKPAV